MPLRRVSSDMLLFDLPGGRRSQQHATLIQARIPSTGCVLFHTGQSHVESLEFDRQAAMVDSQAVENRGVQVVDVDRVLDDVVAEVVGFAVHDTRLDAATRHPDREAARMMVATVVLARQIALAVDGAAKLTAPDNQRVVQQPALFRDPGPAHRPADRCRDIDWARSPATLACWSQPRWKICTNRTSRSAMRRASRQLAANVPGFCTSGPYMSSTCCGSSEMSVSSGTEVCMRYAISYWAMRACVSASPISR